MATPARTEVPGVPSVRELTDRRHPVGDLGDSVSVYVWQYPLRFIHWSLVISIGVLSFSGYYIHSPFIIGQVKWPFLMGTFRFVHEAFGMFFMSLFLLRIYLFFRGNRWVRWPQYVPLGARQFQEMLEMIKFYLFVRPHPVSKIGHNALAALSYVALYTMVLVEVITGLVMYNILRHSAFLTFFLGWIPRVISLPELRLIHFFLMFAFIAFGILHVHLCMLVSREEKRGLMDSIFIGYKVIPREEWEEEERAAARE